MTTDKEAARVEPMTHLERARATLKMLFPKGSPFAQADQAEKLAAVFAQVTNEALERAAEEADKYADECRRIKYVAGNIRSLKVSP